MSLQNAWCSDKDECTVIYSVEWVENQ